MIPTVAQKKTFSRSWRACQVICTARFSVHKALHAKEPGPKTWRRPATQHVVMTYCSFCVVFESVWMAVGCLYSLQVSQAVTVQWRCTRGNVRTNHILKRTYLACQSLEFILLRPGRKCNPPSVFQRRHWHTRSWVLKGSNYSMRRNGWSGFEIAFLAAECHLLRGAAWSYLILLNHFLPNN